MNFFQFFVWGAWLITIANFWFGTKQWDGTQFGLVFGTMGIASLFMPTLTGIIADRWVNAEKLYGVLHIFYALVLFYLPQVTTPGNFIYVMLLAMCFYMPTIALSNSISYTALKNSDKSDVVKDFPPIRVWGTIGFIAAMWLTNLSGNKATAYQFYIAGIAAILLGLYAFTLPKCKPQHVKAEKSSLVESLGLEAFKLFGTYKMALFFIFSMFLGGALQLTNAYGDVFLDEFKHVPRFADSFVVKYSTIIMSISQISETLFILVIPFFLKRKEIDNVLPITVESMTRFNISLQGGVDMVMHALQTAWGGEIFVPKIPSYRILDVAEAIGPNCEKKVIGIRPGEKIHEEMITDSDSFNTVDRGKYYAILPQSGMYSIEKYCEDVGAVRIKPGSSFNSGANPNFLTIDQLRSLIATHCLTSSFL